MILKEEKKCNIANVIIIKNYLSTAWFTSYKVILQWEPWGTGDNCVVKTILIMNKLLICYHQLIY